MRELVYIHTGTSYIATHFFNAQQSYFTYDNDDLEDGVPVDHDVSFREGLAPDGSSTYCPRLLLFDSKANFGSLSSINALATEDDTPAPDTWRGTISEHHQDPIPPSTYHTQLDAGIDDDDPEANAAVDDPTSSVRYWSDFSRVFFHPRGLHRVPDLPEWAHEGGWARGAERFALYDAEHAVLENSFRPFAEECDLLQGVQLALDASSMGALTVSLLTQLRDEHPKLPIFTFCTLSPVDPTTVNIDDIPACMSAISDAMTLHELASLSTITVPLQNPATWRRGRWSDPLNADFTNVYHTSALLAAHIESATFPLRLKQSAPYAIDLASLCAHLNWRGDTPFAALSGAFPLPTDSSDLEASTYDFTHPPSMHAGQAGLPFAQRDVYRGVDAHWRESVAKAEDGDETQPQLRAPLLTTSYTDTPYPIPSSHPQFFTRRDPASRPREVPLYTSLRTTPRTGSVARGYAWVVGSVGARVRVLRELGVEGDVMREVKEGWWGLVGAYGDEDGEDLE